MSPFEFTVNEQLQVLSCNAPLLQAGLVSGDHLLGRPYYEAMPRIMNDHADAVHQVLSKATPVHLRGHRISCFRETFETDINIVPLRNGSEKVTGARVTFSEFRGCRLAARLKDPCNFIDIGKIASSLAHGFKNHLNNINIAGLYLRTRYAQDASFTEFYKIIEDEVATLDNFVNSFFCTSFYNIDQPVNDINASLEKLKTFISMQGETNCVDISFRYGEVEPLNFNGFQVEHALVEVINGAIKASPVGGKLFVESSMEQRASGCFAVIEVRVERAGMAEEAVRVESAPGHGKGEELLVAREIMKLHGGSLEITRQTSQGTSVKLCLPMAGDGAS